MTSALKLEVAALRRECREQRKLLARLARALHKHARTDLAPDAALPELAKLVAEITPAKKAARRAE